MFSTSWAARLASAATLSWALLAASSIAFCTSALSNVRPPSIASVVISIPFSLKNGSTSSRTAFMMSFFLVGSSNNSYSPAFSAMTWCTRLRTSLSIISARLLDG